MFFHILVNTKCLLSECVEVHQKLNQVIRFFLSAGQQDKTPGGVRASSSASMEEKSDMILNPDDRLC